MFQKSILFVVIFLAVLSQASFFPNILPAGMTPDIVLILIIIWTAWEGFEKVLWRSIFSGLILDMIYSWPTGVSIISLIVISYLIDYLAKRFLVFQKAWRLLVIILFIILGTLFNLAIITILIKSFSFLKHEQISYPVISSPGFVTLKILSNLIIAAVVYWPLRKIEKTVSFYNQRTLNQGRFFKKY